MADDIRTMIVTGASSGVGRALSLAAARGGYALVINARRADRLEEVSRTIREAGGRCEVVAADITATTTPAKVVETAMRAFGRIDVVVNNAGGGTYGALLEQSDTAIEAQWQLEVAGPLRLARAALAQLEVRRGQLVFVGTGGVRVPIPHYGAYQPAKAAVRAAAIQLRRELRERGIAVTYVDPGLVASEFHQAMGIERTSRVRAASPERVARAILRGIARRRAVVNAVPWQTAGAVLGEWFGTITDSVVISRFTPKRATINERPQAAPEGHAPAPLEPAPAASDASSFQRALEPVARRMERVKLPADFLRSALVPDARIELGDLAMRWAGMPNKNERAALQEALDALAAGGYLEPQEEGTWRVVRAAD